MLGGIGLGVGSLFGVGQLGFSVGTLVGGMLDQSLLKQKPQSANRLADLKISGSSYGVVIPMVWGDYALGGNIIDYKTDAGGNFLIESSKKKGSKLTGTQRVYSYSASFAVMVCRGPASIRRIWAQDRTVYDMYAYPPSAYTLRVYRGDEQQQPDSLLVAQHGASFTPAYRGTCYVVFQDLPLAEWGNQLPNLSFEVTQTYPDLVLTTAGLYNYYRFDNEPGKLTDIGPKAVAFAETSPASTQVRGCFQLLNGAAGGGNGLKNAGSVHNDAAVGFDAAYNGPTYSVELWAQYKGGAISGSPNVKFQYINPSTGDYSFLLSVQPDLFGPNTLVTLTTNPPATFQTAYQYSFARDTLWHHFVATYNTAGNTELYVDGVRVVNVAAPVANIALANNPLNRLSLFGGDYNIDELAFYTTVIPAADVLAHYQEGAGLPRTRSSPTVGTFLADIFTQEGLVSSQWDVSAATDPLDGLGVTDRQPARDAADPVLRIYNTLLCEYDGKIVAVKRGGAPVATINAADLGAVVWSGSNTPTPKVETKRLQDLELPFRVDVGGFDKFRKYEMSHQGAERYTKTHLQDPLTVQTNLVFAADLTLSAADKMRQAAERLLYQIHTEREQFTFSLPPSYLYLTPGDVVLLPVLGQTLRVRLTQVDVELPGPIHCTAVLDDASVLVQTISGASVITSGEEAADVLTTTLVAWSGPALLDADAASVGLYVACGPSTTGYWPGCTIYWSRDGGTTYSELLTVTDAATVGTAASVLAGNPATGTGAFDDADTVDVSVLSGTMAVSTSDSDVVNGANIALLGDEVIQFGTVTALGGSSYRLSHLLRARRSTDAHWLEHQTAERFALLDVGQTFRVTLTEDLRQKSVVLKAVTAGTAIAAAPAQTVYLTGDEYRCYAPAAFAGTRTGSDLSLTWIRRTRTQADMIDGSDIPLGETVESYSVFALQNSPKTITAVSLGATTVFTSTSHGFAVNDKLLLAGLVGPVYLNGRIVTVTAATTNTFTTADPSAGMPAYVSGGSADKVLRTIAVSTPAAAYTGAQQTTDFGSAQNPVKLAVVQNGKYGAGFPTVALI